jgi:hypothetical protein
MLQIETLYLTRWLGWRAKVFKCPLSTPRSVARGLAPYHATDSEQASRLGDLIAENEGPTPAIMFAEACQKPKRD